MSTEVATVEAADIKKAPKQNLFDFDVLEELCSDYFQEQEEEANAALNFTGKKLILTVCKFKEAEIQVYCVDESPALYEKMERTYLDMLDKDNSSGSDFWDMWNSFIETITEFKLVDEVLNP